MSKKTTQEIGSVPVENPFNEEYGLPDYDDRMVVIRSSSGAGVELSGGEIDGCYRLTDEDALELAGLLLEAIKAIKPADTPNLFASEPHEEARGNREADGRLTALALTRAYLDHNAASVSRLYGSTDDAEHWKVAASALAHTLAAGMRKRMGKKEARRVLDDARRRELVKPLTDEAPF